MTHHKLNKTKPKKFTKDELESIHKYLGALHRRYGDTIPFAAVGINVEIEDFKAHLYVSTNALQGKQKYTNKYLKKELLIAQNQNGVGYRNLLDVLAHWDKVYIPEVVKLIGNTYWIVEGHHRTVLQVLAGRKSILFFVEQPKYKDKNMSIGKIQKEFSKIVETAKANKPNAKVVAEVDAFFAKKNINALDTYITQHKTNWDEATLRYAKNMLEDLSYAVDHHAKYEMACFRLF